MTVSQIPSLTDFTAGTTIVSADVDSNFSSIRTAFNALVTGTDALAGGLTVTTPFSLSGLGAITSGTYTPTLTNVTSVTSSTAYECQYMRVGNVVTVSGRVAVTPAIAGTQTVLGVTLPVASNLGAAEDLGGVAFSPTVQSSGAAMLADTTNDRAQMEWVPPNSSATSMYFIFTYTVI